MDRPSPPNFNYYFGRFWAIMTPLALSFGAGYWVAKHDWGEILVGIVVVIVGGGILAFMVKHRSNDSVGNDMDHI